MPDVVGVIPDMETSSEGSLLGLATSPNFDTILIAGGTSGIGLALAERFHALGNKVIVAGRRRELLDQIAAEYPGIDGEVFASPTPTPSRTCTRPSPRGTRSSARSSRCPGSWSPSGSSTPAHSRRRSGPSPRT